MRFMDIHYRADLTEEARAQYGVTCHAFAQVDVWTTHVYVVAPQSAGVGKTHRSTHIAEMFEVSNEARGSAPSDDELAAAIDPGCGHDSQEFCTLPEALECVAQGSRLHGAPDHLAATLAASQERRAFESMSKYARKNARPPRTAREILRSFGQQQEQEP